MSDPATVHVYKILSAPDWSAALARGHTHTALDLADGYVHLSTREQVAETLRLHYRGQHDVRLLEYVFAHLKPNIRWEESRGGQLFPHLYAPLKPADARRTWILNCDAEGVPQLPGDIDP